MRPIRRMWFILALALGTTVGELQARMGSHEFSEWVAFYRVQPFGELKEDHRMGTLCAVVGSLFSKDGVEPDQFFDFDPWGDAAREKERMETVDFLAAIGAKKKGT